MEQTQNAVGGGDQYARREDSLLDPAREAAKIRAFFVHPKYARHGIGTLILEACEDAAGPPASRDWKWERR